MNFQNPNFVGSNQWTPELMNQWSSNQELLYQNIPHDKVVRCGRLTRSVYCCINLTLTLSSAAIRRSTGLA